MLKYIDIKVVFAEIPDEITLAINISGCPCYCKGCHSPYLAEDVGTPLIPINIRELLLANKGISCVALMGGDSDPKYINDTAKWIKENGPKDLKVAWYSGREKLSESINIENFDYIKLGPYIEEFGPLNNKTTNQKFYKVYKEIINSKISYELKDETYKFWKHEIKD